MYKVYSSEFSLKGTSKTRTVDTLSEGCLIYAFGWAGGDQSRFLNYSSWYSDDNLILNNGLNQWI